MNKLLLIYLAIVLTTYSQTQPTITLQPEDVITTEGESISFKCEFEGPFSFDKAYQWWKNPGAIKLEDGNGITGATRNRLWLKEVDLKDDSTTYTCECIDLSTYPADSSWVNSRSALLRVSQGILKITSSPLEATVSEGGAAKFYSDFDGATNKGYQWWKYPGKIQLQDSENVIGSDSSTLTLLNISSSDDGTSYSCELRNKNFYPGDSSWVMSDTAKLNILEKKWNTVESSTNQNLYDIKFSDSLNGFAWGNKTIIITNNGGTSWDESIFPDSLNFHHVIFVSSEVGWGVNDKVPIELYKTLDQGNNWEKVVGYQDAEELKISFINSQTGWMIGIDDDYHFFITTKDGGKTWIQLPAISPADYWTAFYRELAGLYFESDSVGYVNFHYASVDGGYFKTTDGGFTWLQKGSLRENTSSINDSTAWVIGYDHDSGNMGSWINYYIYRYPRNSFQQYSNRYENISDIYGRDSSSAWIIGKRTHHYSDFNKKGRYVRLTNNGGKEWNIDHFDMDYNSSYRKIYSRDNKTFWIVGDKGIMMKYEIPNDPVSVDNNKTSIPQKIELHQNYPNPFNPTTTIKYSIPNVASSFSLRNVTLKVYDVLGEELATLVNQHQKSGNYEVKFNSEGLSSGIYFYTLKVGEFLDTKKMTLVK